VERESARVGGGGGGVRLRGQDGRENGGGQEADYSKKRPGARRPRSRRRWSTSARHRPDAGDAGGADALSPSAVQSLRERDREKFIDNQIDD
jgi:hypothetical protein